MLNDRGMNWRINRVEKSSFFLNADIETLINNVESNVINELEDGNRQAGMKRLKVPPLSEKVRIILNFNLVTISAKRRDNLLIGNVYGHFYRVGSCNYLIVTGIKK